MHASALIQLAAAMACAILPAGAAGLAPSDFPWAETSPSEDLYGAIAGSTIQVVRTQATYYTRGAAFGPRVMEAEGLRGILIPISAYYHETDHPMHACRANKTSAPVAMLAPSGNHSQPPADWIALVERGGSCPFVDKVRTAQELGAVAVVVGDAPSPEWSKHPSSSPEESDPGMSGKRLLTMFANGDSSDILIPSTFITRPSFLDLRRLISELIADYRKLEKNQHADSHPLGIEIVISRDEAVWEWPLIDLALVLLLLPSLMTITTVIIHKIRQARITRRERAPQLVVHNLPCLIVRGNGQPWEKIEGSEYGDEPDGSEGSSPIASTSAARLSYPPATTALAPESNNLLPPGRTWFYSEECAICLSAFVENDRVRVLPCGHIFHRAEIDGWLIKQKKICPVCKRDITVPVPPTVPLNADGSADSTSNVARSPSGAAAAVENEARDTTPPSERTPLLSRDASNMA